MEEREIIEGLINEYWHSIKDVDFKALKEEVMELDKFINEGDTSESNIQLIYEEIIPHIEMIKEHLFRISALESVLEELKEET